jgi:hypothetical protein
MAFFDTPPSPPLSRTSYQRPPERQRVDESAVAIARDAMAFGVVGAAWTALSDRPIAFASVIAFATAAGLVRTLLVRLASRGVAALRREIAAAGLLIGTAALWPGWAGEPSPARRAVVAGAALLVAAVWREAARLAAAGDSHRSQAGVQVLLLAALSISTWWAYVTSHLVGVVDERWYADLMEEFIERVRTGRWPVWAGEGPLNWNGNVHHFRSGPWQLHLGALIDLLTLRALSPNALNHLTVILSHHAALLVLFAGLRRLRPNAPWLAFGAALLYATSPAVTLPQVLHDMYMATVSMPFHAIALICAVRVAERPVSRWAPWGLGAALGLMWLGHPPEAFFAGIAAACILFAAFVDAPVLIRWIPLAAKAGGVFAVVVAGYFINVQEFQWELRVADPITTVIMPGLAVMLSIGGAAWLGHHRSAAAWAYGLAAGLGVVGLMTAWAFWKPYLIPLAMLATTIGVSARWSRWPVSLVGALVLFGLGWWWGATHAADGDVEIALAGAQPFTRLYFMPVLVGGVHRPGAAVWLAGGLALLGVWSVRTPGARAVTLASVAFLISVLPVTPATEALWQATPHLLRGILHIIDPLRLWLATAPLMILAAFLTLSSWSLAGRRLRWLAGSAAVGLAGWTAIEHMKVVKRSWQYRASAAQTERLLRPERRSIHFWHYDLLPAPSTLSAGVSDPRLETRFWGRPGSDVANLGPDELAQAFEAHSRESHPLLARRRHPAGPEWRYFDPAIRIEPGERKLLRFAWSEAPLRGWLILRGTDDFYRDYQQPIHGLDRAFGTGPESHHTLSVANSSTVPLEFAIELLLSDGNTAASWPDGRQLGVLHVSKWRDDVAPIQIRGWHPLRLLINAPGEGWLETFRSWQPGYEAWINGQPAKIVRSRQGLVGLPISAGEHEVVIEFVGTQRLRRAWLLLGFGVVVGLTTLSIPFWRRSRPHRRDTAHRLSNSQSPVAKTTL